MWDMSAIPTNNRARIPLFLGFLRVNSSFLSRFHFPASLGPAVPFFLPLPLFGSFFLSRHSSSRVILPLSLFFLSRHSSSLVILLLSSLFSCGSYYQKFLLRTPITSSQRLLKSLRATVVLKPRRSLSLRVLFLYSLFFYIFSAYFFIQKDF